MEVVFTFAEINYSMVSIFILLFKIYFASWFGPFLFVFVVFSSLTALFALFPA